MFTEQILMQKPEKCVTELAPLDGLTYRFRYKRYVVKQESLKQSFSRFWCLVRAINFRSHQVSLKYLNHAIPLTGSFFLFLPAFTPFELIFKGGFCEYDVYESYDCDDGLPKVPTIKFVDKHTKIKNYNDIVDLFINPNACQALQASSPCYPAEKTKVFLDRYFSENLTFEDIHKDLRLPRSTMTRSFSDCYGLSPVRYRIVLRVFEAMRLLRKKERVTQAGLQAGFQSICQYNEHFSKIFGASPKHLMIKS